MDGGYKLATPLHSQKDQSGHHCNYLGTSNLEFIQLYSHVLSGSDLQFKLFFIDDHYTFPWLV